MSDVLNHLLSKTNDRIEKQFREYQQQQSNSAAILALSAIFLPLFLDEIQERNKIVVYVGLLPIIFFLYSMYALVVNIFIDKKLFFGRDTEASSLDDFLSLSEKSESYLKQEIKANINSIEKNEGILVGRMNKYKFSLKLAIMAIAFSVGLLFFDSFLKSLA